MVENNIPVKFALFNNRYLGMVLQWQDIFYERSYVATHYTGNPGLCEAGPRLRHPRRKGRETERGAARHSGGHGLPRPAIVDFMIAQEENVYPMIPPAAPSISLWKSPSDGQERIDDSCTGARPSGGAEPDIQHVPTAELQHRQPGGGTVGDGGDVRMAFVVNGDDATVEQVIKQLRKLIDVADVQPITERR